MSGDYYNEWDPFAAAWLRELIKEGLIPDGEVDERSVLDVRPADLRGFARCHFFAGIGGWPFALRLAGRKDDHPGWTASLPCQPLSCAGDQRGHADERHLWPAFHDLVAECRPAEILGEQVASSDGREWFAGIRADLEDMGYACGASDLCAAGVGAPHIRQRLFWVAYASGENHSGRSHSRSAEGLSESARQTFERSSGFRPIGSGMANANGGNASTEGLQRSWQHGLGPQDPGVGDGLGHAEGSGLALGEREPGDAGENSRSPARQGFEQASGLGESAARHPWTSVLIPCADGKFRRIPADETGQLEPQLFPLAHGVPNRMGTLRGAGNAINPYVAAKFIQAAEGARLDALHR